MTQDSFRLTPPPVKDMTAFSLPPLKRRVLPSGIEMLIYDRCDAPVSFLSYVSQGGSAELPSPAHAALISILRREGTRNYSGDNINSILDFNGALFKGSTSAHHNTLSIRCLNSTLPNVIPVFKDMIFRPSFPRQPFSVRREALARNLEVSLSDVDYLANCIADRQIHGPAHPAAITDSPLDVRNITPESIRQSFSLIGGNGSLFVAGNITPEVEQLIALAFSSPDCHSDASPLNIQPLSPVTPLTLEVAHKPDALQNSVILTLPGPDRSHPDYIPLHITVSALGGYFGSRLMLNIREKLGLTYGISASLLGTYDGAYIQIQADTDCDNTALLLHEIKHEMLRLASCPPSGNELHRLRQSLLSSQAAILDSPFSITDFHITALTANIPDGYFRRKLEAIQHLSPNTIASMASRYLRPELIRTAIAGRFNP